MTKEIRYTLEFLEDGEVVDKYGLLFPAFGNPELEAQFVADSITAAIIRRGSK